LHFFKLLLLFFKLLSLQLFILTAEAHRLDQNVFRLLNKQIREQCLNFNMHKVMQIFSPRHPQGLDKRRKLLRGFIA
jgi:hypothetical protein